MVQIFYYSAPWCGPCTTFGPLVDELIETLNANIIKYDIDSDAGLASGIRHHVKVVPTLVKEKNGIPVGKLEGAVSKEQLQQFVEA